jgi:hypothetical protein
VEQRQVKLRRLSRRAAYWARGWSPTSFTSCAFNRALTQRRVEVTGERRLLAIPRLLLRNGHRLDFWQRLDVQRFLDQYPALREVYLAKEALHRLYRTRRPPRARRALNACA